MDLVSKKTIFSAHIFDVEELVLTHDGRPFSKPMLRLTCADWANVLAVTPDNRAILVRQPRAGLLKTVLETPGGLIDPGEKDPTMAAVRELEEETGFTSQRVLPLGAFNPNPAIMSNRIHFFLALGCLPTSNRRHFPDEDERIQVTLVDLKELDSLVRTGQIDHALSALCIMLAGKYLDFAK